MRIYTYLILVFLTLNACSDIEEPREEKLAINDEVVLSTLQTYLVTQEVANKAIVSNPQILLNNIDLATIQQLCSKVIDTSLSVNYIEEDYDISFDSELELALQCNDLGFPTQIFFSENTIGEYMSSKIQGAFDQVSSYQVSLNLIDLDIKVSGITGNTGNLMLQDGNTHQNYSTSLRLDVEELFLDIQSQKIISGSALATISYNSDDSMEQYIVDIEYLDNSTIQVEFNGKTYILDFGN